MADGSVSRSSLPVAGLAGLALATFFVFVSHESPYLATRPPESAKFPDLSLALQHVDARLWQDPFSAVEDFEHREVARRGFDSEAEKFSAEPASHGTTRNKSEEPPFSIARFGVTPDEFKKLVAPESGGSASGTSPRALPVLMSGSHFVGAEEARRRTRYAVLAALDELGYAPVDGDHIGYVVVAITNAPAGAPPVRVPFEAFQAAGTAQRGTVAGKSAALPDGVVVLWVDESALIPPVNKGSTWLDALASVLRNLNACPPAPSPCDVPVIGPSSSDRYQALVGDLDSSENPPESPLRWLVSPFVTSNLIEDETIRGKLQKRKLTVVPTIVPDRTVIDELLDELSLRKVPLCDHSKNILLVGEWDTEYGRRAQETFRTEFNGRPCPNDSSQGKKEDRANILTYSFVRGLDGVAIGSSSKPAADSAANPSAPFMGGSSAQIEWPESPDQRDYLRRIGPQLSQRNLSRRITAVGILASDTHDKLLLLQGLRGIFPRAVFFTTDVDARYMHPLVQQWARNLIIAGAYGLALDEDVQRRTPPFRDGYQTSTFLATSLALQIPALSAQGVAWQFLGEQPVRRYEVGRTHLVPLRTDGVPLLTDASKSTATQASCSFEALKHCQHKPLQPRYQRMAPHLRARLAILVAWLISVGAMFWWALRRPVVGSRAHWTAAGPVLSYVFLLGLAISLFYLAKLLWQVAYPDTSAYWQEPLLLAEGVSSWPIAILWCFGLALNFMFLVRIARTVSPRLDATRARFVGTAVEEEREGGGTLASCLQWLKESLSGQQQTTTPNSPVRVDFADIWDRYQRRARGWRRVGRIFGLWLLLFVLPFLLVHGKDLAPPPVIRGAFHNVVWTLDSAHFVMLTVLMAGVADAAILCTFFVLDVGRARNTYPKPVLQAMRAQLGLCEELEPYLDKYIDCEVIGERTAAIAEYLYYPFIVLAVLVISMTSLFDDWVFSFARVGLYALHIGVLLLLWLGLHGAATRTRAKALAEMERMWIKLQSDGTVDPKAAETMRRQFPLLVNHVRDLKVGAYGPLLAQPIFRALLWPLGSLSSTQLLQYLFLR